MAEIAHPAVFLEVAGFLIKTAEKEILYGAKPSLTKWKGKATAFKIQLFEELGRYARRQFPFNHTVKDGQATIQWWEDIACEGSENAQVLPVCH